MSTKHPSGRGIETALTSLASGLITERDRLRASNKQLLGLLKVILPDWEHCALEVDPDVPEWRMNLLTKVKAAIAKAERPV